MKKVLTLLLIVLLSAAHYVPLLAQSRAQGPASRASVQLPDLPTAPPDSAFIYYEQALDELRAMLEGHQALSFKRAVFLTENAYLEHKVDYARFNHALAAMVDSCRQLALANGLDFGNDPMVKFQSLHKFLTDTVAVIRNDRDTSYHLPYRYDFHDFNGERDWRQMFVIKLLSTRQGNCHSLPYLYRMLAEEMQAPAYLALAPNHIYIKHRSNPNQYGERRWINVELTNGTFPMDSWTMAAGYIKVEAVVSGIYLDTLSLEQSVALSVLDLAKGYERKFGRAGDFVGRCVGLALAHYPNSVTAKLLWGETIKKHLESLMVINQQPNWKQMVRSGEGKVAFREMERLYADIYEAGYAEMPRDMYLNWLFEVRATEMGAKSDHIPRKFSNKEANPFRDMDIRVPVVSMSDGRFDEVHDEDTLVRIGSVIYNRFTQRIEGLISSDSLARELGAEPDVASRFTTIDPEADEMPDQSPYSYAKNNPLRYVDPDGRFPIDIIADAAFILYDIGDIAYSAATGQGVSNTQWQALGADVVGAVIPYATGLGAAVRAGKAADRILETGRTVGRTASRVNERANGSNKSDDAQKLERRAAKLNKDDRAGEDFTKAGKDVVKKQNEAKNGGAMKCENCDTQVVNGEKHTTGNTPLEMKHM